MRNPFKIVGVIVGLLVPVLVVGLPAAAADQPVPSGRTIAQANATSPKTTFLFQSTVGSVSP
jgi:hypothetical protein